MTTIFQEALAKRVGDVFSKMYLKASSSWVALLSRKLSHRHARILSGAFNCHEVSVSTQDIHDNREFLYDTLRNLATYRVMTGREEGS